MNIHIERVHIERMAAAVRSEYPDDDQLLLDCLEGQTQLFELASSLLGALETEEANEAALCSQIELRQSRLKKARMRQTKIRQLLAELMKIADLGRLALPEATLSLREGKAALTIPDKTAVPETFVQTIRKIDKRKINEEFADRQLPNWLSRTTPSPILTVRRK